ncbi:sensor histidine kinase [Paenibacillus lycopersici]|uniref:histidine kinase n=1 Tax=Paenibacillus lycopersici TaxID=2704462 RepID=A0A6C0FWH5_9BACL|nr:sensor histidine kinase [Paenibacillus lycopersici]QHT58540.1 sensor histidine kinase [Paenibacillus lycopersici]
MTATSLLHLRASRKLAAALIPVDLLFGIYLVAHADGIDGPFVGYGLFNLFLLKRHLSWKPFYAVSSGYVLLLPVIAGLLDQTPLAGYFQAHAIYVIYAGIFFAVAIAVHRSSRVLNSHLRSLARICSSAELEPQSDFQEAVRQTEAVLGKLLGGREVWICISATLAAHEPNQSWMHAYFANSLRDMRDASKAYIRLPSPIGELIPFYVRKLQKQDGTGYGWLLVKASEQELSLLQIAYIQLVRMKFMNHCNVMTRMDDIRTRAAAIERDQIAQDIHDGIAQELFFLSVQLFQLKSAVQKENLSQALPILSEMETKVKESHQNIRTFIVDLKGEKRRFNLRDAIENMLQRTTANSGIALDFRSNGWVAQEKIEIEEAIYHFIEESVNNVMKHAGAAKLLVTLEVTSVQWSVLVRDDGAGMNWDEIELTGKLGIAGMTKRIKALNGSVSIQSQPAQGTTITAAIPRERSMAYV